MQRVASPDKFNKSTPCYAYRLHGKFSSFSTFASFCFGRLSKCRRSTICYRREKTLEVNSYRALHIRFRNINYNAGSFHVNTNCKCKCKSQFIAKYNYKDFVLLSPQRVAINGAIICRGFEPGLSRSRVRHSTARPRLLHRSRFSEIPTHFVFGSCSNFLSGLPNYPDEQIQNVSFLLQIVLQLKLFS